MLENLLHPSHLLLIAIVMLLVGPKRLPSLAKSLRQAVRELRREDDPAETTAAATTYDQAEPGNLEPRATDGGGRQT